MGSWVGQEKKERKARFSHYTKRRDNSMRFPSGEGGGGGGERREAHGGRPLEKTAAVHSLKKRGAVAAMV